MGRALSRAGREGEALGRRWASSQRQLSSDRTRAQLGNSAQGPAATATGALASRDHDSQHAQRSLPGGTRKYLRISAGTRRTRLAGSYVDDFPRSLVLLPPPSPTWGSDSTRKTRCKLSRSRALLALPEPRSASVSARSALCGVFGSRFQSGPRDPLWCRFLPKLPSPQVEQYLPVPASRPNLPLGGVCSPSRILSRP